MQKFILLLLLLFSFSGFSQDSGLNGKQAQQIVREKGRFYVNGSQISTRETRQLLASNPEALKLFKQAKTKGSIGGLLIGLGSAVCVTDLAIGLFSDVEYPSVATYIGAGLIVASIPVLSGKNKKMDAGLELYNGGLKKLGENDTELNLIANQNGYGLQLRF